MQLSAAVADRIASNFEIADLGDRRRTRRLVRTVAMLARRPTKSVPAACVTDAAVQGAYRLVNNARVDFDTLLAVQATTTAQRASAVGDVLVLHDTSDCKFSSLDPAELGYLNTGKAGFRLHTSLVVEAAAWRRPLGVIAAETTHRLRHNTRGKHKSSGIETAGWDDKEFARWLRGLATSEARLAGCRTIVHVADRESDSYELMAAAQAARQRFVFRVRVDRRGRSAAAETPEWSTVKALAHGAVGVLEREVELTRRVGATAPQQRRTHPPRKARCATLRFAATRIEIPRPRYLHAPIPPTLTLNLIHVVEIDTPTGQVGVEWLLYTTEPVETAADIERVVDIYRSRWLIEEFFAALKGGCAFEEREFESRHALLTMLAMSLPIACEVLAIRSHARTASTRPATDLLTPLQLRVLRTLGHRPLGELPSVEEALFAVAGMGGHMKRNGPPGWKVLSRGMTELLTSVVAWEAGAAAARREM